MKIVEHQILADKSHLFYLDIPDPLQVLTGYLLEGLDGYCYHTISSLNGKKLLKITVAPNYYDEMISFFNDMESFIYDKS